MLCEMKTYYPPVNDPARMLKSLMLSPEQTPEDQTDTSLEDAAQHEQEYLRERLRDELKREPTETELNEWLRQHTEGY